MSALLMISLLIGAIYGAYQGGIRIYQKVKHITNEEATKKVNNRLADIIMGTPDFFLAGDDFFKQSVIDEVSIILTEEQYKLWVTVANNVVNTPVNQSGLPGYYILLYLPDEESRLAYELSIGNLAKISLRNHNCPDYVLLDWAPYVHDNFNVNTNKFEWLYIRYARTNDEKEILNHTHLTERDAMINSQSSPIIHDEQLENELKKLNKNNEGDSNNGR